jgi:nucleotide sugar dehydrogenase
MNILIVGYGIVGQNMRKIFNIADIYDPKKRRVKTRHDYFDLAFICVPTPKLGNGECDTSIVEQAILENKDRVKNFCIKSTVPPGFTENIITSHPEHSICFSPEYFGGTQHANNPGYNFLIVGGGKRACDVTIKAHKEVFTGSLKIFKTDSTTAELVKYGENAWLGYKVSFVNEFKRICDQFNVDFDNWREMWLADPRINRSHTFVYNDKPFYDSHCLSKDIPAIIFASNKQGYKPELLEAMERYNNKHKAVKNG